MDVTKYIIDRVAELRKVVAKLEKENTATYKDQITLLNGQILALTILHLEIHE